MRAALPVRLPRRDPRARPRCLAHQQTAAVQDAVAATTSTSARACCILTEPTPPVRYSQAPPVRYSLVEVGTDATSSPRRVLSVMGKAAAAAAAAASIAATGSQHHARPALWRPLSACVALLRCLLLLPSLAMLG